MTIKDKDCVILYANGPNQVVVPITVFRDIASTKIVMQKLFPESMPKEYCNRYNTEEGFLRWSVEEDDPVLGTDIFKSAYFGCGGPSSIYAKPLSFGELKVFVYDLD